jgi:hypothetical protein
LIRDLARLSKQLRLLIVQDCLSSLDELLVVDNADDIDVKQSVSTDSVSTIDDCSNNVAAWAQLQQLSCAHNFIPKMDISLVKIDVFVFVSTYNYFMFGGCFFVKFQ